MTTANFVKQLGWRAKEPWLEEVRVPDDLPVQETGRSNRLPIAKWSDWGVVDGDGAQGSRRARRRVVLPMGRKGPAFIAYPNYDVYL